MPPKRPAATPASTRTRQKPPEPEPAVIEAIAVDIGNDTLKLDAGYEEVIMMESCCGEVVSAHEVGKLKSHSQYLHYVDGDRTDLIGRHWVVGKDAWSYASGRVQRVVDGQGFRGKIDLGLQLVLAALPLPEDGDTLELDLMTSVPDTRILEDALIQALQGTHTIERQDAEFTVIIHNVVVKEEGEGALYHALAQNAIQADQCYATIDWGGGSTITQVYTEDFEVIPKMRLVQDQGVNDLAVAIATDERFRKHLGKKAQTDLVLQGIRQGTYKYGAQKWDFRAIFEDQHRLWLKAVAQPALKKLEQMQDRISKILLIGGGAPLAEALVGGPILICPDPQEANVLGLRELLLQLQEEFEEETFDEDEELEEDEEPVTRTPAKAPAKAATKSPKTPSRSKNSRAG